MFGRVLAILVLTVPLTYAAVYSPDDFRSAKTVENKGAYSQTYEKDAMAGKFDVTKKNAAPDDATPAKSGPATDSPGAPSAGATESKSYGSFTLADLKAQVPQSKEGNFMLEVPEIYYTAGDKEVQTVLSGQPVETIAQVLPEKVNNENGTRLRIFRLQIQCCAADARPYSIPVDFGKKAPSFKDMTWVKVVGKMSYRQEGGQSVPVIEASSMIETAEPDSKMIY